MIRKSIATTAALFVVLSAGSALAQDSEEPRPGLFGTSILEGWKKSVGLGFTGTDGNVNESQFQADFKGEFENDRHRRKLTSQFYLSKPDNTPGPGPLTERKAFVDYEENWKPFQNMMFFIGTARYDYERFQSWNSRLSGSLGIGYELYKTERTSIRGSVGAGVAYKFQTDAGIDEETIPEGVVRLGLDHNVMKGVDFSTNHVYYPNLDDTGEHRVISDAELKADIGEAGGLNVAVGVQNEYDTIANNENPDVETNDLTYYIRLGYDF